MRWRSLSRGDAETFWLRMTCGWNVVANGGPVLLRVLPPGSRASISRNGSTGRYTTATLIDTPRFLTNPPQAVANLFRFRAPWFRDNRHRRYQRPCWTDGIKADNRVHEAMQPRSRSA